MNESVIIITGGSRGIGWATAVELARRGARLCLTAKQWPDARAAEKMLTDEGARGAWAASSDVSSSESCTALVAEVLSRWQRVDGLVNNAGKYFNAPLTETTDEQVWEMMRLHVGGSYSMMRAVGRTMLDQRSGSVVNIGSILGDAGSAGSAAYAASKAALAGLTKSAAKEWGARNVRVNMVSPGIIDTAMISPFREEISAEVLAQTPLRRLGSAQDVANAIVWLLSDASAFVTGATLRVDGGLSF